MIFSYSPGTNDPATNKDSMQCMETAFAQYPCTGRWIPVKFWGSLLHLQDSTSLCMQGDLTMSALPQARVIDDMRHVPGTAHGVNSTVALFVDFDNVFRALEKIDTACAANFASNPMQWLSWLEQQAPFHGPGACQQRSILLRRCYMNPDLYRWIRKAYIHTAFSVVDCPSLTAAGKNCTDIHMVLDILDTLEHRTHFEEFIIFSGDADFTPVLLRLRAHRRRTTILTIGNAAGAYKAAADTVIDGTTFVQAALRHTAQPPSIRLVHDTKIARPQDEPNALNESHIAQEAYPHVHTPAPLHGEKSSGTLPVNHEGAMTPALSNEALRKQITHEIRQIVAASSRSSTHG
jgi:hypothetical protein